MPNPKSGTVTTNVEQTVQEFKKGKVAFKVDKLGSIHLPIGKVDFTKEAIVENFKVALDQIIKLKNEGTTIILSTHRMESVEEMCDHIALIHKSNKLIEGKLSEVKRQFRTNTFQIGIMTNNIEGLMYQLSQKFTIGQTSFKSLNDDLKLEVNLGSHPTNDLLQTLFQFGQVTHFAEKIPSVNDIFIQTVSGELAI